MFSMTRKSNSVLVQEEEEEEVEVGQDYSIY